MNTYGAYNFTFFYKLTFRWSSEEIGEWGKNPPSTQLKQCWNLEIVVGLLGTGLGQVLSS
jgi:hypothetical protein